LAACGEEPPEANNREPGASERAVVQVAPSRPDRTKPYSDRPILGSVGDKTCNQPPGEMMLGGDDLSCLTLLFTSIKVEDATKPDVKLAKTRAAFYQPGPPQRGKRIGWITYDMRIDCASKQGWMLSDIQYDPDGAEIMRETVPGGAAPFPNGGLATQLIEGVCEG
jgi:hypothetical protein